MDNGDDSARDFSLCILTLHSPQAPLVYVSQPKERVDSEDHHVVTPPTFVWTKWLDDWRREQGNTLEGDTERVEGEVVAVDISDFFCSYNVL
jgi:hypothetical protein